ncbi:MAG: heme NO-binding domain-containing protein [Bacteroidetes bacterium]|nr:heme NO-binding domain-containing protein [Bacteroidota bacterium]
MKDETRVHGSIFFLLKKFIDHSFPAGTWETFLQEAGAEPDFEMTQNYPLAEISAILKVASRHTGKPANELKEAFGEYLVPDLFQLYGSYLRPEWKTYDVLMYTEKIMHGAVRKLNSTANPPILNVTAVSDELMFVDYFSKRRMGSLAVGIIKGIARYYNEYDKISVIPTTDPDAERVQIRLEFK